MARLALLVLVLLPASLAGCAGGNRHDALADMAREVPVPSGGSLVAVEVRALGPKGAGPYVGEAMHRYEPTTNATRLVALVRASLEDHGWTMGNLTRVAERAETDTRGVEVVTSARGTRGEHAIEVKAGRFKGGTCCVVTDDPGVGILLVVRVTGPD